jgi:uncharacterized delta-60 repeat protein
MDGSLDPTFGTNGLVTTSFSGSTYSTGYSVAIDSNGKIILGGTSNDLFALARYNSNGSLDTTFGTNGLVTTSFGDGSISNGYSVAIDSNGKIILCGFDNDPLVVISGFALARYNSNGSLDTTFGTNGLVTTLFDGGDAYAYSVAIDSNGKIILGGVLITGEELFALARYNSDGSLDTTFGTNGLVTTFVDDGFGTSFASGKSVAIDSNGRIILGGSSNINNVGVFALVRYNSNGSLDTTFGTNGLVTTSFGGNSSGNSVALDSNGKIILGGTSNDSFALARYNSNGSLDTTFGTNGLVTTSFGGGSSLGSSVALDSNGKIILGGYSNNLFALARYNSNGSLDTTFGTNGLVTTSFGDGSNSNGKSVAIDSNQRIILGGFSGVQQNNRSFALAAYIGYNIPCFKEESNILCFKNNQEQYIPIQNLRKGDLVKTRLNGYVPINMIGKREIYNISSRERIKDQLYKCSQDQYPEIFEPLIITGCHSILVDEFKDEKEREKTFEINGDIFVTDQKYRLPACVDERTSVYEKEGIFTIYHFALEHDNYYMNYGIYANGLLVETCSKRYLKEISNMELIE